MLRQILTRWSVPNASRDITTVMNFDESISAATQRAALAAFWTSVSPVLHSSVSWSIESSGRILDESTGGLVGTWSDGPVISGVGSSALGDAMANATMLLIRWRAPLIVNGRRVQGRTFIPGPSTNASVDGEVEPETVTGLTAAARSFVDSNAGLGVWSRPAGSRPGRFSVVNDGDCWAEFAVQRNRRG